MLQLFFKPKKTAEQLVRKVRDGLNTLDRGGHEADAANASITKNLAIMKDMVYKGLNHSVESGFSLSQLAQQLYSTDLLLLLIKNLHRIQFEARKDVVQVFNNILIREFCSRLPTVDYICSKPAILYTMLGGYQHREISFSCGSMLRECAHHEPLAKIMVRSEEFFGLFDFIQHPAFDTSYDAFSTFSALLTTHKAMVAKFLEDNYDRMFGRYVLLLKSNNYVTRRESLKLLSDILLTRQNYHVMIKYVSDPNNLKLIMKLLVDKARYIQFEAFNVFKVFAANPNHPRPILKILLRNQQRIVLYLTRFLPMMTENKLFLEEKAVVIDMIQNLKPLE
uniref:Mo25-like protein n=1 Tax=Anopheles maculatus TaxID=74869 RepID=A0A182T526_9DIPT